MWVVGHRVWDVTPDGAFVEVPNDWEPAVGSEVRVTLFPTDPGQRCELDAVVCCFMTNKQCHGLGLIFHATR